MEHLITLLDKFLTGSPRTGWLLLVFGTAMILLGHFEVLPSPEIIPGWQTLFWGCIALGITMLIVSLGAWTLARIQDHNRETSDATAQATLMQRMLETGNKNVAILGVEELRSLLWLLRTGEQRFIDGDFTYGECANLLNRYIVLRDRSSAASDIFFVNDIVWSRRDELLKRHSNHIPYSRPW